MSIEILNQDSKDFYFSHFRLFLMEGGRDDWYYFRFFIYKYPITRDFVLKKKNFPLECGLIHLSCMNSLGKVIQIIQY